MPVVSLDYPAKKLFIDAENDIEAGFRAHCCVKEPWTVSFIERIPAGGIFWDIGANVGGYTLIAASRGIQTVAVEPMPINFGKLGKNLALNHLSEQVVTVWGACHNSHGWELLNMGDMRTGASANVIGQTSNHITHRQKVLTYPLDVIEQMVGFNGPHYLKIDVDGHEVEVLQGAEQFLSRTAALIIEMPLAMEQALTDAIQKETPLRLTERYDHREGQKIGGIVYCEFIRP